MPRMTKRWRNAALIFAFLGFVAVAIRALPQSEFVAGATSCAGAAYSGGCFREVPADPSMLVFALVNGAILFGVVYGVFLLVRAARR